MSNTYYRGYQGLAPEKKHSHKALKIFFIVLAVIVAAILVLVWMIFSDPYKGKGLDEVKPSAQLLEDVKKSAIDGKECSISKDTVNGFLSYLLGKGVLPRGKKDELYIRAVAAAGTEGSNADIYVPITYNGKNLAVTANITPSIRTSDSRPVVRVNSIHLGRLSLPVSKVLSYADSSLPESCYVTGDTIVMPDLSLKASVYNISFSTKLSRFQIENGSLKFAVSSYVSKAKSEP